MSAADMSSTPDESGFERWWFGHFHPLVRVGWRLITSEKIRSQNQVLIGLGVSALGLALRRKRDREVLYRGVIPKGGSTRIRVTEGGRVVQDREIGE